ncbi:MAG: hypothetical protein QM778_15730 [Myxococcales bacterium]
MLSARGAGGMVGLGTNTGRVSDALFTGARGGSAPELRAYRIESNARVTRDGGNKMVLTIKQGVATEAAASKQLASLKVAQAAAGVEAALEALGLALREDAQLRVNDAMELVKRGIADGEGKVEALVARVPGLGPWLAMEMFRVTHAKSEVDELQVLPTNFEDSSEHQDVAAYLECIGCHMA